MTMRTTPLTPKIIADRIALSLMTLGILMVWQPWAHALFRWGFVVTLAGVILFTVSSHMADNSANRNPMKPQE